MTKTAHFVLDAESTADKAFREFRGGLSAIESKLGSLKSIATAVLSFEYIARPLAGIVKGSFEAAETFGTLSEQTGIAVETLSTFGFAAQQTDTDIGTLAGGMQRLAGVMYDADAGVAAAADKLEAVGVRATDAQGNLRPLEQVLLDVADRFATMEDGAEKTALAAKLFGRSAGPELIPFLNQGRQGIEQLVAEAKRLGLQIDGETAEAVKAFNDDVDALKAAASGLGVAIANDLAPELGAITKAMREAAAESGLLMSLWVGLGGAASTVAERIGLIERNIETLNLREAIEELKDVNDEIAKLQAAGSVRGRRENIALLQQRATGIQARINTLQAPEPPKRSPPRDRRDSGGDGDRSDRSSSGGGQGGEDAYEKALARNRELQVEFERETAALNEQIRRDEEELTRTLRGNQQDRLQGLVDSLMTEREQIAADYADKLQMLDQAKAQELTILGGYDEARRRLEAETAEQMQALAKQELDETAKNGEEAYSRLEAAVRGWGDASTDVLAEFVTTGKLSFSDLAESILNDLARIAIQTQIIDPLIEALNIGSGVGGGGGGIVGAIGNFIGGLFKAEGGPVTGGRPYIVGEEGPELFVPGASGAVVPNDALLATSARSSGGSVGPVNVEMHVEVINQASGAQVQATRTTRSDGVKVLRVLVKDALNALASEGQLQNLGLRPSANNR